MPPHGENILEEGTVRTTQDVSNEADDVTRPIDHTRLDDILSLAKIWGITLAESTFDLSPFDLTFRPKTYWPEGFTPFVAEPDAPPIDRLDANGEVYQDADGRWHTASFPDEVMLASMDDLSPEMLCARRDGERIRYRWVCLTMPEVQDAPEMLQPGIKESDRPLSFGELIWSLDNTTIGPAGMAQSQIGYLGTRWHIDEYTDESRTGRMLALSAATPMTSTIYPALERYIHAVCVHFIQTGEFFEMIDRPE
ncbi:MAG TPA: hypothetical protein VNZ55_04065 [Thermomicrobiales bacterium]|nr:hypothetical protein [Thermomicrobiales bacterium]